MSGLKEAGGWMTDGKGRGARVAVYTLSAIALVTMASAWAGTTVPGGGQAKSDCYVVLDASGSGAFTAPSTVTCTDGDPSCDQDGACNDSCTFRVRLCVNQPGLPACVAPLSLDSVKPGSLPPPGLIGENCGSFVDKTVQVRTRGNRKRPGKLKIKAQGKAPKGTKPRVDKDTYVLVCQPRKCGTPGTAHLLQGATTPHSAAALRHSSAGLSSGNWYVSPDKIKIKLTRINFAGATQQDSTDADLVDCVVTYDRAAATLAPLLDCPFSIGQSSNGANVAAARSYVTTQSTRSASVESCCVAPAKLMRVSLILILSGETYQFPLESPADECLNAAAECGVVAPCKRCAVPGVPHFRGWHTRT